MCGDIWNGVEKGGEEASLSLLYSMLLMFGFPPNLFDLVCHLSIHPSIHNNECTDHNNNHTTSYSHPIPFGSVHASTPIPV
jgi:hypothetical protein